jgi:uncharacterized protein (TIGR03437 family)
MLARGVLVLTLIAGLPAGGADNRQYTTGQAAIGVVGQATFSANVPGPNPDQMGTVSGVAVAGNRLIVSDGALPFTTPSHNRILIFNNLAAAVLGSTADVVIGQTDFTKTDPGLSEKALNSPIGVSTDGVRLAVADSGSNRVLLFNNIPTVNGASADVVVGQSDFKSLANGVGPAHLRVPHGVFLDGRRLFIADTQNHRVLIFNSVPTSNGASADVVLGQADFNTMSDLAASQTSLRSPTGVFSDGQRLVITDLGHNRVLIYNRIPTANNAPADVVVGQPDFTTETADTGQTHLNFPRSAIIDGGRLLIADGGNNRVLVYNQVPVSNGVAADAVLGQKDFQTQVEPASDDPQRLTAGMMSTPVGLALAADGIIVADSGDRRVLRFAPGVPLFYQGAVVNVASFDGNGLPRATGVNVDVQTDGSIPAGTYYIKVTAEGGILFESMPSEEVSVTVPDNTKLVVTFDEVSAATAYRVYLGGSPGGQTRYFKTDTPATGEAINRSVTITTLTSDNMGGPRLEITPGAITALFGSGLAEGAAMADSLPLPTELGGVSLFVNGTAAPLFYVSPTQINFQVPWETVGSSASLLLQKRSDSGLVLSNAVVAPVSDLTPGLFSVSGDGTGRLLAFHADGSPVTDDSPIVAGESIFFFGTGVQQVSYIGNVIAIATLDTHPTGQISVTADGTITWSSSYTPTSRVYLSEDGADESLLAENSSDSISVEFITAGHVYAFNLHAYDPDTDTLGPVLASVTLDTRTPGWGDVSSPAVPSPTTSTVVPTGDQTGTISVDTTGNVTFSLANLAQGRVYMTTDGGPEMFFADVSSTSSSTSSSSTSTSTSSSSTAGAVSTSKSTVVANPTTVNADNTTTSTITVTLLDANGNPVSGKNVSLTAGSGSSTITVVSGTTNSSGQATFTVTDGTTESVTYTAKDTSDNLTIGTVTVTFASNAISGSQQATISNGHFYQFILRRFGDPLTLLSGEASPARVAVNTTASVSIQGYDAPIQFVGLVPGFVGLLQWNVSVASDISMNGEDAEVKVFVGSIPANLTYLPILEAASGTIDVTADGTVTWSTSDTTGAQVFVTTDGGDEVLFAESQSGSQQAGFVEPGHVYVFVLRPYRDGVLGKVLATATLDTTAVPPVMAPTIGRISVTTDGTVTWSTNNANGAHVTVSTDGGGQTLFSDGQSGSEEASFIRSGHVFVFTLRPRVDSGLGAPLATATLDTTPLPDSPALTGTISVTAYGAVTWSASNVDDAQVTVLTDDGPETAFATGLSGIQQAGFIEVGHVYLFVLRQVGNGVAGQVLATATLDVTTSTMRVPAPKKKSVGSLKPQAVKQPARKGKR